MDVKLYSDAGVREGLPAAGACIIQGLIRHKLAFLIPVNTPFLAELHSGIIGLHLAHRLYPKAKHISWFTDSKTLVEVASRPQHQEQFSEYWGEFDTLARRHTINVEHMPATGEILRCDRACRWMQSKGEHLLQSNGEGPAGKMATQDPKFAWFISDFQDVPVNFEGIQAKLRSMDL